MYAKIFTSIYQGTLRGDTHGLVVFTNLLAHADSNGWVDIHPRAIAEETGLSVDQVRSAIHALESPDPESRSPEEEGRRIVRLDEHRDWGWRIVNHGKYRAIRNEEDRREQNRLAQQRWREKNKPSVSTHNPDKPIQKQKQIQKKEAKACASPVSEAPPRNDPIPYQRIADLYNQTMRLLPKVAKVNASRKTLIRRAWEDGEERKSLEFWTAYFEECEASNFLNGKGPYTNGHENWRPDFDYLMQGKTILRTYEKALTRMEQEQ